MTNEVVRWSVEDVRLLRTDVSTYALVLHVVSMFAL